MASPGLTPPGGLGIQKPAAPLGGVYPISVPPWATNLPSTAHQHTITSESSYHPRSLLDREVLLYRLGYRTTDFEGFLHVVQGKDKMHVFIIAKDQGFCLEDEKAIFPSDGLVAQAKLLLEASK